MHGIEKTTVYLPESLKVAVKRAASATGTSEAGLIRNALERATSEAVAPRPRLPLFRSRTPNLAEGDTLSCAAEVKCRQLKAPNC